MPIETAILFFITDLSFCMIPGPATMITVSHAMAPGHEGGMRGALGPMAGINVGNLIWYALTALGLAALIATFPTGYAVIRWFGVFWLIWTGVKILRAPPQAARPERSRRAAFAAGFGNGLAVHMANPKALVFYIAIIPPFIDHDLPLIPQFLTLAGITLITENIGLGTYAMIASRARNMGDAAARQPQLQRISGGVIIAVAMLLLAYNLNDLQIITGGIVR
ncbi:MAG: LysE family translocator [Parasphingorhabdus sp.]|nr:LysE family translocator [Parasphingorhabdus sp.]